MTPHTVALQHDPWAADQPLRPRWLDFMPALYRRAVWIKANPRSPEYMRDRLVETFPEAHLVSVAVDDWRPAVRHASTVIILYPDSIGLGFGRLEGRVRSLADSDALLALTGRRRVYELDRGALRRLRRLRFIEWAMLGELIITPILLAVTPILKILDTARGRR